MYTLQLVVSTLSNLTCAFFFEVGGEKQTPSSALFTVGTIPNQDVLGFRWVLKKTLTSPNKMCFHWLDCYKRTLPVNMIMIFPAIGSMYGIFTYIYHKNQSNVGKSTIHGSCGIRIPLTFIYYLTCFNIYHSSQFADFH